MKLFFTLFLLAVSALIIVPQQYAQIEMMEASPAPQTTSSAMMATAPAMMKPVNYTLPYPGMLPDNPLYKLKLLRDKITLFLIGDPQKKAEFYLLQADKGMAMVQALLAKKENSLAAATALKAENNYTLLIYTYQNNGIQPSASFYKKLQDASRKHQEILSKAIQTTSGSEKKTFADVLYFSKVNWQAVQKLNSQEMMQ